MSARAAATFLARLPAGEEEEARRLGEAFGELFDETETAIAAFETPAGGWAIEILFRCPPDEAAVRALVKAAAGEEAARGLFFSSIAEKDWVASSLADLKPVAAGRFVVHGAHDRRAVAANCIAIEIEAALAFGTGHHATTHGCLAALDHLFKARRPRKILDVGTGTGVLAIAAARALRRQVVATDIDRDAVMVARQNIRLNRAAAFAQVVRAAGVGGHRLRTSGPFDLAIANILMGPLKGFATKLAALLGRGARLILSGLTSNQAAAVLAAYRAHGIFLERRIELDGWATLVLRAARARGRPHG